MHLHQTRCHYAYEAIVHLPESLANTAPSPTFAKAGDGANNANTGPHRPLEDTVANSIPPRVSVCVERFEEL